MRQLEHNTLLEQYAQASNTPILRSQSDLSPNDSVMNAMLAWCRDHPTVVVLQSGDMLCSDPAARVLRNCKIVMHERGLLIGNIRLATHALITTLLENAQAPLQLTHQQEADDVSVQQQRLRLLVQEALHVNASDIHIEVRRDKAVIRFRKHGELTVYAEWLPKLAREVVSVAFNQETDHAITHFNPLVPQNASMPLHIDGRDVRLRLASLPAHGGFDVVLRLLTMNDEQTKTLEQLGYLPEHIALISKAVSMPHGAVILAGPTGSGKTTTLASCMHQVEPDRKVYTIEDPVEKAIPGATQIPVNTEHYDRSFASMARTALRMDPDVMVLGEMRDEDTAQVMMRAAITGHLVFSTLHTNSAPDIVTRLHDLGVSHALLASPDLLVCLICQRLAPLLCESCKVPGEQAGVFHRGKTSCNTCRGLGIHGRTVVAEVIWVDEQGRQYIQQGDVFGWKQYLQDNGWTTYRHHLLQLVKKGVCDPRDAEKLMGTNEQGVTTWRYAHT